MCDLRICTARESVFRGGEGGGGGSGGGGALNDGVPPGVATRSVQVGHWEYDYMQRFLGALQGKLVSPEMIVPENMA